MTNAPLSVRLAAAKLGVSPSLVYALCRAGVIPHARHGRPGKRGTIRIDEAALEEYRRRSAVEPAPQPALQHLTPRR